MILRQGGGCWAGTKVNINDCVAYIPCPILTPDKSTDTHRTDLRVCYDKCEQDGTLKDFTIQSWHLQKENSNLSQTFYTVFLELSCYNLSFYLHWPFSSTSYIFCTTRLFFYV